MSSTCTTAPALPRPALAQLWSALRAAFRFTTADKHDYQRQARASLRQLSPQMQRDIGLFNDTPISRGRSRSW